MNRRVSAKSFVAGDQTGGFKIWVESASIESAKEQGDVTELVLTDVVLRNHYDTVCPDSGKTVRHVEEVLLSGDSIDDAKFIVRAGSGQRMPTRGLTANEKRAVASAPAEQITEAIEARSERERSAVASQLLASLSETERNRLFGNLKQ